ncbi:LacI family DNA-binding transcriptional regulator [Microlunatus ginsengisoli]|uniref:LacI family DNA-binding transcriptional regulator n=1 Tax=Microlunatus ginsengisoli TaxID=363863 RepID=A0ABP6ZPW4_9ACTN
MKQVRTTLAEVAAASGVSIATVSKVLNDHTDVAETTRRRVQQALHDADYRAPRRSSRRPERVASTEPTIEVAFPEWQNAYEVAVLDGLTSAAEAEGYEVVIGPRVRGEQIDFDPQALRRSGRAGAIFVTVDASRDPIKALSDTGFPVVVVDPVRVGRTQCVSIGATNFTGGVTAVEHLLSLGHRRIAHAAGPVSVECSHARLAGYHSALRQAAIEVDDTLVTHSLFTYDGGRAVAARLLDRPDPPTAVFAACDEIALGIVEEARRRSIRVPEDLSVIGFDDSFLASRSAPPLTTVAQPLLEMGRLAVRSLTQLIAGDVVATRHLELATHLVVRDSTAPLGGSGGVGAQRGVRESVGRS